MMKSVLGAALAEELTDHLGYEHGDPGGRGSRNSRNGSTPKTLLSEAGPVELATCGSEALLSAVTRVADR